MVYLLSIVKVSKRRIYIPKEIPFSAEKVIIIPLGSNLLIVPVPDKPIETKSTRDINEIKKLAERKAKKEAISNVK